MGHAHINEAESPRRHRGRLVCGVCCLVLVVATAAAAIGAIAAARVTQQNAVEGGSTGSGSLTDPPGGGTCKPTATTIEVTGSACMASAAADACMCNREPVAPAERGPYTGTGPFGHGGGYDEIDNGPYPVVRTNVRFPYLGAPRDGDPLRGLTLGALSRSCKSATCTRACLMFAQTAHVAAKPSNRLLAAVGRLSRVHV